jgi:hypothetical protein
VQSICKQSTVYNGTAPRRTLCLQIRTTEQRLRFTQVIFHHVVSCYACERSHLDYCQPFNCWCRPKLIYRAASERLYNPELGKRLRRRGFRKRCCWRIQCEMGQQPGRKFCGWEGIPTCARYVSERESLLIQFLHTES